MLNLGCRLWCFSRFLFGGVLGNYAGTAVLRLSH